MLLFSLLPLLLAATPSTHALPKVLLFTATAGYRHASIPVAIDVIQRLGNGNITLPHSAVSDRVYSAASQSSARWETVASENDSLFENESYLEQFDAIVFALTSDVEPPGKGTVLSIDGANRLAEYIQRGGGFVGIHSAADTLYDYPWFGRLVGAFFSHHAPLAEVKVKRARGKHPSISHLPDTLSIQEEVSRRSSRRHSALVLTLHLSHTSRSSSTSAPILAICPRVQPFFCHQLERTCPWLGVAREDCWMCRLDVSWVEGLMMPVGRAEGQVEASLRVWGTWSPRGM